MSSDPARKPLNATAASLLGFLHEGPMSGWDLSETARNAIGEFWSVTQSQVYRELAGLEAGGLVRAGEPGRRDRRPYTITAAGRRAFGEWLDREPPAEQVRFPLLLTLAFGRHLDPARLAGILAAHRSAHQERLTQYEGIELDREQLPYAAATLAFGVHYERAVLAWFDELPGLLGITPMT